MGKEKIILIGVLVLGLGLRLININQSLWLDEASQAQMSDFSISKIWSGRSADFHPPLFYIIAHYWIQFGRSEIWLRLLPVAFGVANIYVIYLFGRKFKLGIVAAFLLAIAPFHIYYSQEFRAYSLLCLLGTLSMYFLFQKKYIWVVLLNALLLYTHYSSLFLILTQFVIDQSTIRYSLFTILLYTPWLPQFASQLNSGVNIDSYLPGWRNVLSAPLLKALPLTIFKIIAGRISFLSRYAYGIYITFVFATTFIAVIVAGVKNRFLHMWAFAPIIMMILTSLVLPQNQPFRVIYILPAFVIIFSQACIRFPKLFATLFIYISIVGNLAYFTRPRLQREQWRQAIEFIRQKRVPAIVKFSDKFSPFYWYAPDLKVIASVSQYPATPAQVNSIISKITYPKILMLRYLSELTDPKMVIEGSLSEMGYEQIHTYNFEGVGFIDEFIKKP